MQIRKLLIVATLILGPMAANADLIGDDIDALLSNPNGAGSFQINPNFGSGNVGPGIDFTATASDAFGQIWDFSIDVFGDGFTLGFTERTRNGDGNITDGDDMIRIELSDLDWVGMVGEIVNVSLFDYSCVSAGFSCETFGGGPSHNSIVFGADYLSVDFNTLRDGELYTFAIDAQHVPEPGTMALLGMGLLGMGLARRRRKA